MICLQRGDVIHSLRYEPSACAVLVTYRDRVAQTLVSPSTMTPSFLRSEQRVDSAGNDIPGEEELRLWYNQRPYTPAALPASLAYEGFGRFIDGLKPGAVVLVQEDYNAAAELCRVGHRMFVNEDQRRDAVNAVLSKYIGTAIKPLDLKARKWFLTVNLSMSQEDQRLLEVHPVCHACF